MDHRSEKGQVVAEYAMLLGWVAAFFILAFYDETKNLKLMDAAGQALAQWLNDVIFIICLPS